MRTEMRADHAGKPYDERTVHAIVKLLEGSKHNVHKGAAKLVAEYFLPDGKIEVARRLAAEKGWPIEAVLAGAMIGSPGATVGGDDRG